MRKKHKESDKDFLTELQLQENDKNKMRVFQQMFSPKFYYQEFRNEHFLSRGVSYFCSTISLLTGLYFLSQILKLALGHILPAVISAFLILIGIEISKHLLFPKAMVRIYGKKGGYMPLLALNVVLILASVFMSVKGIETYSNQEIAKKPVLKNLDSLRAEYDKKLSLLINEKEQYINSVSWKGKINTYDKNISGSISSFDQRINELNKEKKEHLDELKNSNKSLLESTGKANQTNTLYLVIFCAINEALCLFVLWYVIYYKYRSSKEIRLFLKNMRPIEIGFEDFPLIIDAVKNFLSVQEQQKLIEAQNQHEIGFELPKREQAMSKLNNDHSISYSINQANFKKKQENSFNKPLNKSLNDYPEALIEDIQEGITDRRTLTKKHKVNVNTINEVIKLLNQ